MTALYLFVLAGLVALIPFALAAWTGIRLARHMVQILQRD
jgi:hypothetical protein